jgi:hypothetical protein
MRLTCQECAVVAEDDAFHWRALLAVDPDDAFEQPMLAFYCPTCAEREFGLSRRIDTGRADTA